MAKSYYDNKRAAIDTIVLALAIVLTGPFLNYVDASEFLYEFSRRHEYYELDEIILTIACSSFYLSIFTLRRFFDLRKLVVQANTDPLIGVLNRRRGSDLLRREIGRVGLSAASSSIILFDLDNFKSVNDHYGHEAGDDLLKLVTSTVERQIRRQDVLIRWDGEEFLILCPRSTLDEASILAERCRKSIEVLRFKERVQVTASFGVTALKGNDSLESQIERADRNMNLSKGAGKNKVTAS